MCELKVCALKICNMKVCTLKVCKLKHESLLARRYFAKYRSCYYIHAR